MKKILILLHVILGIFFNFIQSVEAKDRYFYNGDEIKGYDRVIFYPQTGEPLEKKVGPYSEEGSSYIGIKNEGASKNSYNLITDYGTTYLGETEGRISTRVSKDGKHYFTQEDITQGNDFQIQRKIDGKIINVPKGALNFRFNFTNNGGYWYSYSMGDPSQVNSVLDSILVVNGKKVVTVKSLGSTYFHVSDDGSNYWYFYEEKKSDNTKEKVLVINGKEVLTINCGTYYDYIGVTFLVSKNFKNYGYIKKEGELSPKQTLVIDGKEIFSINDGGFGISVSDDLKNYWYYYYKNEKKILVINGNEVVSMKNVGPGTMHNLVVSQDTKNYLYTNYENEKTIIVKNGKEVHSFNGSNILHKSPDGKNYWYRTIDRPSHLILNGKNIGPYSTTISKEGDNYWYRELQGSGENEKTALIINGKEIVSIKGKIPFRVSNDFSSYSYTIKQKNNSTDFHYVTLVPTKYEGAIVSKEKEYRMSNSMKKKIDTILGKVFLRIDKKGKIQAQKTYKMLLVRIENILKKEMKQSKKNPIEYIQIKIEEKID